MDVLTLPSADAEALAEQLASYDSMRGLPLAERMWLVSHAEYRRYAAGEILLTPNEDAREMLVQLSGRIVVYFGHDAARRHVAESRAGSITGLLPFSRLKRPPSNVIAEDAADCLVVDRDQFPALINECPELVATLVHNMVDRARRFAAADWQDEKVMALGRLSAGLAHELNNPAAAASRAAGRITGLVAQASHAAHRFGAATATPEQRAQVTQLVERCQAQRGQIALSSIARADLEDRFTTMLDALGVDDDLAPMLVEGGVTPAEVQDLGSMFEGDTLRDALAWIAASSTAAAVAADVERATQRIHHLVSAVRGFSHMDRAAVREPTDVARGVLDSVDVLRHKANERDATLTTDIATELPRVMGVAPDLNQVWFHLIDNALDAARGGQVHVRAFSEGASVTVCVSDDGPGIAPDIQPRIFDPFFTTKPQGEGIGFGLDIVRRIARDHSGDVTFVSAPGRTIFTVRLPAIG